MVLGITADATADHVRKAYRQAVLLVHPDKCDDDRAKGAFLCVAAAQEVLSDNESRAVLDVQLDALAGREEAVAPAEQYGWWGAPGDSDAALWLVHDASVIPPSGPSVSLHLFNGQPDPASARTDDEMRTLLLCQDAEANLGLAGGTGRLVWVYIFNNERHFAHGWTLYWATGSVEDTSLQRVAILQSNGSPGPLALQPQHRGQIRRATTAWLGDEDYTSVDMRHLATHPAGGTAESGLQHSLDLQAVQQVQLPPEARLNLPSYITTWLSALARAKASVTVLTWRRLQAVLGDRLDARLLAFTSALKDGSVSYPERSARGGNDLHHQYETEVWFREGTRPAVWRLAQAVHTVHLRGPPAMLGGASGSSICGCVVPAERGLRA